MNDEVFANLKEGTKVILVNPLFTLLDDIPPVGTILTRKYSWIDDDSCNMFTFEMDGKEDNHFFYAEEVEIYDVE